MSSSSQAPAKSDLGLDELTFPSPSSSVRSKSTSQRSSRRSSPIPVEANGKRRRSSRLTEIEKKEEKKPSILHNQIKQPTVPKKPVAQHQDKEEPQLVLKKRKLINNDKTSLPNPTNGSTPKRQSKLKLSNGKLHFEEPPLADPTISVTGLPLEAPPSSKIKRESLWPKKKGKKSKSSEPEDHEDDLNATPEISLPPENIETKLRTQLKTNEHEKIIKSSELRTKIMSPIPKPGTEKKSSKHFKTKPSQKQHQSEKQATPDPTTSTPKKTKKQDVKRKVKNSSPKKLRENAFGFDNPIQLAGQQRENAYDFNDNTKDNDDFCASCGEPGIFLCCESCPKSFHFACCFPPLDEDSLPDGAWFCNECKSAKHPPNPNPPGLFSKLLNHVDARNPIQFQLPKRLRERFEGVVTGKFGEYEDTDYKPYRPTKVGTFEQTDPDHHFDKDGNILYCKKCGESGISSNKLNGVPDKLITTCDYCSSAWHLDCLDPPLSSAKQLGTKWKCPNHADHLIPNKQRRLRRPNIVDVDQIHGFKNNGDIEVKLKEEEEDGDFDDSEVSIHEIPTPAYMANRDTNGGIAAEIPKSTLKLWNDQYAIYRIPEEGILADFTAKVIRERAEAKEQRQKDLLRLTRENNELLKRLTDGDEFSMDERKTVKSLMEFPEVNFKGLAQLASNELDLMNENQEESIENGDAKIPKDELEDLLMIKKLLAFKGKEQFMKFLKE